MNIFESRSHPRAITVSGDKNYHMGQIMTTYNVIPYYPLKMRNMIPENPYFTLTFVTLLRVSSSFNSITQFPNHVFSPPVLWGWECTGGSFRTSFKRLGLRSFAINNSKCGNIAKLLIITTNYYISR